mmetsp:Transcript_55720/g.134400  ORF Transcript_55720/g.134400 Transcript_55720/m.134400 type:complete len:80 (+) Transcript_55720:41-280(+)
MLLPQIGKPGSDHLYRLPTVSWTSDALAPEPPRQLHVLRHDRDPLGMYRTEVCVFKEADKVCLGCFLKSKHSLGLKLQV